MSSRTSRYLAALGNTNEREVKEHEKHPCLSSLWSLSAQLILDQCSGQILPNFFQFPLFLRTAWDRKGGICVLGALHPCAVTPAAVPCTPRWHRLVLHSCFGTGALSNPSQLKVPLLTAGRLELNGLYSSLLTQTTLVIPWNALFTALPVLVHHPFGWFSSLHWQ